MASEPRTPQACHLLSFCSYHLKGSEKSRRREITSPSPSPLQSSGFHIHALASSCSPTAVLALRHREQTISSWKDFQTFLTCLHFISHEETEAQREN